MLKLSDHLYIPPMGQVIEEKKRSTVHKREYAAARINRLNSGWTSYPTTANADQRNDITVLRARSRQMFRDVSHFRHYQTMCVSNVIGRQGIRLQCRAYLPDGKTLDRDLNKRVEAAFWEWGHREHCSASGKISWIGYQELLMRILPRDGAVLFRKVFDKNSTFGFRLKQIDITYLDPTFNRIEPNGSQIIMSVEVDDDYRPIAYWLTTPPSDQTFLNPARNNRVRFRVPASEIIHIYVPSDDESQSGGIPWAHAAMLDAKNLYGYKEGVITSARAAANWVGFIEQDPTDEITFDGEEDPATGLRQNLEIDNSPGQFNMLEPGMRVSQIDPKQPTQNHEMFYKSMVRDMAAALNVNYFSLQGDYAEVNLSSGRLGLNEERDVWRAMQTFIGDTFCREVYHTWLEEATLSGALKITGRQYRELQNPTWRGRGWDYMDPQKEITATLDALRGNLTTYTQVYAEKGLDLVDVLEERKQEMALFNDYGIDYMPEPTAKTGPAADTAAEDGNAPPPKDKPKREFTNGHDYEVLS